MLFQENHTHCPVSFSLGTITVKDLQSVGGTPVDAFRVVSTSTCGAPLRSMWMQGGYTSSSISTFKVQHRFSYGSQDRILLTFEANCCLALCTGQWTWLSRTYTIEACTSRRESRKNISFIKVSNYRLKALAYSTARMFMLLETYDWTSFTSYSPTVSNARIKFCFNSIFWTTQYDILGRCISHFLPVFVSHNACFYYLSKQIWE